MQLGGVTVPAASVGGITEPGLVAGEGVVRRCGPEACRGELALAVAPAVLIQVIREPVQQHARDAGLAASQLLIAASESGPGCTNSWPMPTWMCWTRRWVSYGRRAGPPPADVDELARARRAGDLDTAAVLKK